MKVVEHAALLGTAARDRGLAAALDTGLGELGFTPDATRAPAPGRWPREAADTTALELCHLVPERGAWVCLGATPAMGRAIATRLAARLTTPIQVFTVTARYDDRKFECIVEDHLIRPDGKRAQGTLARTLEDQVGGNWRELADGKSHALVTALLDAAIADWIVGPHTRRDAVFTPPASLGDRRLDELALRIRLAPQAALATVEGRACIRVTTAEGATTMSFLTPDELARLEASVGTLLSR